MRVKKKILGMPILDRKLSPKELQKLSEDDFEKLGIETRFWPWYFETVLAVARMVFVLTLFYIAIAAGVSILSGKPVEYATIVWKFLRVMMLAPVVPFVTLAVSYLWWFGVIAVDKMRGR